MNWQWPLVFRSKLDEAERIVQHLGDQLAQSTEMVKTLSDTMDKQAAQLMRLADALHAHTERSERDMVRSEARYSELMAAYRLLRVQGHAEPVAIPTIEPAKVDPVLAAVNAKAPDARTRSAMLRKVAEDREKGVDDETIILRIQRGNRPAEEIQ